MRLRHGSAHSKTAATAFFGAAMPFAFSFVHFLLPLLLASARADGSCASDIDCQLNGVCAAGACVCDTGWIGRQCEQLDLLPMPAVPAYGWSPNVTSWGGSPAKGDDVRPATPGPALSPAPPR